MPATKDSDQYNLANYVQDRPACLRFLRAARGKVIPVTVLRPAGKSSALSRLRATVYFVGIELNGETRTVAAFDVVGVTPTGDTGCKPGRLRATMKPAAPTGRR